MFNKEYYDLITNEDGTSKSEKVVKEVNTEFIQNRVQLEEVKLGTDFELQVKYPGLLIGIGNAHSAAALVPKDANTSEVKSVKGEIALGFSFDYVTGVPYIPGSTVKGVLRSAFKHTAYIQSIIGGNTACDVAELEKEIFDGLKGEDKLPSYKRDIFFDAFPSTKKKNGIFRLMEIESITPHGKDNDIFQKINPITLVKVRPGVVFRFQFRLHDGIITAGKKKYLFKKIITDLGIGAKTNVGFGVLGEVENLSRPLSKSRNCTKCKKKFELQDWMLDNIFNGKNDTYKMCSTCFKQSKIY
jgi:CRISPR-associated protein Cmr6